VLIQALTSSKVDPAALARGELDDFTRGLLEKRGVSYTG
jgi:hypothetical protein